jgi:amino acid transporter
MTPAGTEPELKRTLGSFQVFAISFAFISVAVGIFGTYDDLLRTGGPLGIWLWPIVACGQGLVALVIAQFAARIALTGSSYQWASRLASARIGWGFGWLTLCWLGIGVVAADNALASQAFMPLFSIHADEGTARLITLAVLAVQAVLAIASVRIVALLNSTAVVVELALIGGLAIALIVVAIVTGHGSTETLTSRGLAVKDPNYFGVGGGLMLATLTGLATLVGFDSAANLAEEAKDPYRTVPRTIISSVVARGPRGRLLPRPLGAAGRDPRVGLADRGAADAGAASRGAHPDPDRRRTARGRGSVLRPHADLQPRGAGGRGARPGRRHRAVRPRPVAGSLRPCGRARR